MRIQVLANRNWISLSATLIIAITIFSSPIATAATLQASSFPGPSSLNQLETLRNAVTSGPAVNGLQGRAMLVRTLNVATLSVFPPSNLVGSNQISPSLQARLATFPDVSSPASFQGGAFAISGTVSTTGPSYSPSSNSPAFPSSSTTPSTVNVITRFDALNQTKSNCGCIPPDVIVAAGPNYLVEQVNLAEGIYSKQGSLTNYFTLASFYNTSHSLSDPKILFDLQSGRWFSSILDITANSILIAISSTSDPFSWKVYQISAAYQHTQTCAWQVILPDQPIIGVSDDKVVVQANDFALYTDELCRNLGTTFFAGSGVWALNKAEMISGSSAVDMAIFPPDASGLFTTESLHPVQSLSTTTTEYLVSDCSGSCSRFGFSSSVYLYSIVGVPPGVVALNSPIGIAVSSINPAPAGLQLGTNSTIDTGDIRVLDAAWFQGKLWLGLDNSCVPSGDNVARSCIRLVQIDTTTNQKLQDVNVADNGFYFFYPALRLDNQGDLELVFGYSSQTSFACCYPSIAVSAQGISDPIGTFVPPQVIITGSANDTSGLHTRPRYGDYFGAAVDPSDPSTVWVAGEYHNIAAGDCWSGNCWSTYVSSIKFNGLSLRASPSYLTVATSSSATSTVTLSSLGGFSGTVSLTSSITPKGPTTSVNPTSVTVPAGGSASTNLTITASSSTPSGPYIATVTATIGSRSYNITIPMTVGPDFSIAANPVSLTVAPGLSTSSTITLQGLNSFTGTIYLSNSTPVGGPRASLSASSVTLTPNGSESSTLTISTTSLTPLGRYLVIVNAVAGQLVHSVTLTITVRGTFTIATNPSTIRITCGTGGCDPAGGRVNSVLTLTSVRGFFGTVSLTYTPPSPNCCTTVTGPSSVYIPLGGSGNVTITAQVFGTTSGTYAWTIGGNGGGFSNSTTLTIIYTWCGHCI